MSAEVFGITKDELFALILSKLPPDVTWTPAQLLAATALAGQMILGPQFYDAAREIVAVHEEDAHAAGFETCDCSECKAFLPLIAKAKEGC